MMNFAGVDYGSKLAGTTVITFLSQNQLVTYQSPKGKNADDWLKNLLSTQKIGTIYIDAPLSLPSAYCGKGDNFHYRKADQMLHAMSPMFLGGLTARAI